MKISPETQNGVTHKPLGQGKDVFSTILVLPFFDTQREADDFSKLLQNFNCILRVLSSWRKKVNIEEFEEITTLRRC